MKTLKRIMTLVVAICMVCSVSVTALAAMDNTVQARDYIYREFVTEQSTYPIDTVPPQTKKTGRYLGYEDIYGNPIFAYGTVVLVSTSYGFPTPDKKTCTYEGYIEAHIFE